MDIYKSIAFIAEKIRILICLIASSIAFACVLVIGNSIRALIFIVDIFLRGAVGLFACFFIGALIIAGLRTIEGDWTERRVWQTMVNWLKDSAVLGGVDLARYGVINTYFLPLRLRYLVIFYFSRSSLLRLVENYYQKLQFNGFNLGSWSLDNPDLDTLCKLVEYYKASDSSCPSVGKAYKGAPTELKDAILNICILKYMDNIEKLLRAPSKPELLNMLQVNYDRMQELGGIKKLPLLWIKHITIRLIKNIVFDKKTAYRPILQHLIKKILPFCNAEEEWLFYRWWADSELLSVRYLKNATLEDVKLIIDVIRSIKRVLRVTYGKPGRDNRKLYAQYI